MLKRFVNTINIIIDIYIAIYIILVMY